jgi:hypothetical protein
MPYSALLTPHHVSLSSCDKQLAFSVTSANLQTGILAFSYQKQKTHKAKESEILDSVCNSMVSEHSRYGKPAATASRHFELILYTPVDYTASLHARLLDY